MQASEEEVTVKLSHLNDIARVKVLEDLQMIDVIFYTQVDPELNEWMIRQDIWSRLWRSKVVSVLTAPNAYGHTLTTVKRLGDKPRQNCIAWYFAFYMCEMYRRDVDYVFKKPSSLVRETSVMGIDVHADELPFRVSCTIDENNAATIEEIRQQGIPREGVLSNPVYGDRYYFEWEIPTWSAGIEQFARLLYMLFSEGWRLEVEYKENVYKINKRLF